MMNMFLLHKRGGTNWCDMTNSPGDPNTLRILQTLSGVLGPWNSLHWVTRAEASEILETGFYLEASAEAVAEAPLYARCYVGVMSCWRGTLCF